MSSTRSAVVDRAPAVVGRERPRLFRRVENLPHPGNQLPSQNRRRMTRSSTLLPVTNFDAFAALQVSPTLLWCA